MPDEKIRGIFIPENILRSKDISMFAKVLYGEITSICERDGFCKKTNAYLAELCGVQKCIISRWIKKFKDKKFLKVRYKGKYNYIRFIFLPTVDENTIKKTIQTYYSIVPMYKNSKEYRASKQNALNNTSSFDDLDFNEEDMEGWLDNINVK